MPTNQDPLVLTIDQFEPLVLTVNPPYVGAAFSPTVDITETPDDVTVTITDIDGEHSYTIEKTDQAISAAETAAASANSAASSATTAAENANAAASRVDSAIADAEDAAESANAAAELATAKAELADDAAALANTKAGLADVAAENANAKATLADNAASAATSAASQASSAADDAENATTAANSAATSASNAASSANDAATLATEKAELADIAATNANDKASLADTAAATANASATNADAKATAADTAANAANNATTAANSAAAAAAAATVDTEAATAAANSAASSATSSAASADTAAANANAAADRVDTAIDDAESAATAANSAATSATDAASAANSAASNANQKATLADTAASNADTKAGLADTAASAANSAAQSASSAASTAITAATNADAKATAANTAASAANTAASSANDAADRVDAALETLDDDLKISDSGSGSSVLTNGCALLDVEGDGWAEQDGTPTPENPQEVRVAKGRNLANLTVHDMSETSTNQLVFSTETDITYNAVTLTFHVINAVLRASNAAVVDFQKLDGTHQYKVWGNYSPSSVADQSYTGDFSRTEINITFAKVFIAPGTWNSGYLDVQLEAGSTATPYVPYGHVGLEIKQGSMLVDCIPVPIPEEGLASVRDGTEDLLRIDSAGHVVVKKRVGVVDLGSLTWIYDSTYLVFTSNAVDNMYNGTANNLICSMYVPSQSHSAASPNGTIYTRPYQNGVGLGVKNSLYTDAVAFKAAMSGVLLYYELATHTTIDLGYIDLPLMPDGCTVSIPELHEIGVEWVVTRAEAIPEMVADVRKWSLHEIALASDAELSTIAAVENATASTNYAVGSYLVHGGTLYRVTTAIATGETITPGSNVTATTVMAELIRLTA